MTSIIDQIKARRAALSEDKYVNLEIPTWGGPHPRAWIRVQPVPLERILKFKERAEKTAGPARAGAVVAANLSIIGAAAVKVIIGEGEDRAEFELDSPDLLEALEIPDAASRSQVIAALVGTDRTGADGYILALSDAVGTHSGHSAEIAEETLAGE